MKNVLGVISFFIIVGLCVKCSVDSQNGASPQYTSPLGISYTKKDAVMVAMTCKNDLRTQLANDPIGTAVMSEYFLERYNHCVDQVANSFPKFRAFILANFGSETQVALHGHKTTKPIGDADIREIQKRLNKAGFNVGIADGLRGKKFNKGIVEYCKARHHIHNADLVLKMSTRELLALTH